MFSQLLMDWIEEGYTGTLDYLEKRSVECADRIRQAVKESASDEQVIMKYYFGAMPYSDLADTDFSLLRKYARHAVFLRSEIPWCRNIPEKTFLMDVAAYRINNEKIMDCRKLFFDELWERVKGLSMKDAVLEANYWCAEHASYHLADPRTASALTVYRCGFGRCGEESVFTVTALRSIGIPARQVYTPLWAHCDDNHAWVEAWCDGAWYFLGACEPEEVLNKGWFTGPASRAMLLHVKYFTGLELAEAEFTEGFVRYVNRTDAYAHTTMLTAEVTDESGLPVTDATVHFQLLNESSYRDIAVKQTDLQGRVTMKLGKGSIRLCAVKNHLRAEKNVSSCDGTVKLVLGQQAERDGRWQESRLYAPDFARIHPEIVTAEQKQKNKSRAAEADRLRLERISSYYKDEKAALYPSLQKRLRESAANFEELIRFLERDQNPYRVKLLEALTVKDMYDLDADVLEEHLEASAEYADQYPEDVFVPYLLNPRVENEELSCYREFLKGFFTAEQKKQFTDEPGSIMVYIDRQIGYDENRDFEPLRVSPRGALELGVADPVSRKILFCAICRTLGIPARMNQMNREPAYYRNGRFIEVVSGKENGHRAELTLEFAPDTEWNYLRGWSLSVMENDMFHPLGLFNRPIENGKMLLSLPEGIYRLLITVRIPDGDQLVREMTFTLHPEERRSIYMSNYQPQMDELLINKTISSVEAVFPDGRAGRVEETAGQNRQMVLWLDPGKEPTQHVLNELLDNLELCRRLGNRIVVLLPDKAAMAEPVFAKVQKKLPDMLYMFPEDWDRSEQTAQELNLSAHQYPLVYVMDKNGRVIYADCGYNVGSADLMLKLMTE